MESMKIALGADHAGFELKERIKEFLRGDAGHEVIDLGTDSTAAVDYPDFAEAVGLAVRDRRAERGIILCGSGVGASVAANKIPGVRAGLCHDHYSAHQGVQHDDINVLVLGGRVVGESVALELVAAFLAAHFSGDERHRRRLDKVKAIEKKYSSG
jgi:RpiB/LacA/LacB family sugar-phosphate isomerase